MLYKHLGAQKLSNLCARTKNENFIESPELRPRPRAKQLRSNATIADNIQNLPVVTGTNAAKIYKFCQMLTYNVQSLETPDKLSACLAMVRGGSQQNVGNKSKSCKK